MPTAILIDGAFFVKRFRCIEPHNRYNGKRAAELAFRLALAHLREPGAHMPAKRRDLYRIFFYDCPPLEKRLHNPISKRSIDFAKSQEAVFRTEMHAVLRQKRKLALRLGHLASDTPWTIKVPVIESLLKGRLSFEDLQESDVVPHARQKGVDMRIGIDISSLALKKQVDQIVLVAGDADFVPAAKLARREGVDFILDPLWQSVPAALNEHIDGLRTTCARPRPAGEGGQDLATDGGIASSVQSGSCSSSAPSRP